MDEEKVKELVEMVVEKLEKDIPSLSNIILKTTLNFFQ
jgi:hypothetical protein